MEACKSCDHNVRIECEGGCFFPHNTPPCFRQAMESQTTVVQQLKAEIATLLSKLPAFELGDGCWPPHFYHFIEELRQLSRDQLDEIDSAISRLQTDVALKTTVVQKPTPNKQSTPLHFVDGIGLIEGVTEIQKEVSMKSHWEETKEEARREEAKREGWQLG